jgi:2,3,4,5-tetrahydropyridine-2-carboxylate N-succinyltransferase
MSLQSQIEALWERRDTLSPATTGADRDAVDQALELLDSGQARVAEPAGGNGGWRVNQWLKQAVLLPSDSAILSRCRPAKGDQPFGYDKVPLKWTGWDAARFKAAGFRVVPGAVARARPTSRPTWC